MSTGPIRWQRRAVVLGAILALSLLANPGLAVADTGSTNPNVLPPNSAAFGRTYADWSAAWWQWAFSVPAARSPFIDDTGANCGEGQAGRVWFLAGTYTPTPVEGGIVGEANRTCAVPVGKALFFPVINAECSTAEGNGTGQELIDCATGLVESITIVDATLDGEPIEGLNPSNSPYRVQSPLFSVYLPPDNILGLPSQTTDAAADGYYLLVKPLQPGQHVITFHGKAVFSPDFFFEVNITYHLNVLPDRAADR